MLDVSCFCEFLFLRLAVDYVIVLSGLRTRIIGVFFFDSCALTVSRPVAIFDTSLLAELITMGDLAKTGGSLLTVVEARDVGGSCCIVAVLLDVETVLLVLPCYCKLKSVLEL